MAKWSDLPNELISEIATFYVISAGPEAAWKGRAVNKVFADCVADEILDTHPYAEMKRLGFGYRLLSMKRWHTCFRSNTRRPNQARFLLSRITKKDKELAELFRCIKESVDFLLPESSKHDDSQRQDKTSSLCFALATSGCSNVNCGFFSSPNIRPSSLHIDVQDKLVAAVLGNNTDKILECVKHGASLSKESPFLGIPIPSDLRHGYPQPATIKFLLECFSGKISHKSSMELYRLHKWLRDAIITNLRFGNAEIAHFILHWTIKNVPLDEHMGIIWKSYLQIAMKCNDSVAARTIACWQDTSRWPNYITDCSKDFLRELDDVETLSCLQVHLPINCHFAPWSILSRAAYLGAYELVLRLLQQGATPDGPVTAGWREFDQSQKIYSPLECALLSERARKDGNVSKLTELLLSYGATFHGHPRGDLFLMYEVVRPAFEEGHIDVALYERLMIMRGEEHKRFWSEIPLKRKREKENSIRYRLTKRPKTSNDEVTSDSETDNEASSIMPTQAIRPAPPTAISALPAISEHKEPDQAKDEEDMTEESDFEDPTDTSEYLPSSDGDSDSD